MSVDLNKIYRQKNTAATTFVNEPEASPPSARVLYAFYQPGLADTPGSAGSQQARFDSHNVLNFVYPEGGAPAGGIDFKLEAPYLEIDPASCGNAAGGNIMSCRCNPNQAAAATGQTIEEYMTTSGDSNANKDADARKVKAGNGPVNNRITVDLNEAANQNFLNTFWEHAPFAGQDPMMRTYRRICVRPAGAGVWEDTSVLLAVTHACQQGANGQAFNDGTTLSSCQAKAVEGLSIRGGTVNTLAIAGANTEQSDHDRPNFLGDVYSFNGVMQPKIFGDNVIEGETAGMLAERLSRTVCCGANGASLTFGLNGGRTADTGAAGNRYGVCINSNSNEAQCCGRRPYNPKEEKCCNRLGSLVENLDGICPCSLGSRADNPTRASSPALRTGVNTFTSGLQYAAIDSTCDRRRANVAASGDFAGLTNAVAADGSTCCDITRTNQDLTNVVRHSMCTGDGLMCCNDGSLFDPATQQCCPINGVQNLDLPCPCSINSDCAGSHRCCFQAFPLSVEDESTCNVFANYPIVENGGVATLSTGPALAGLQQCRGSCYDPSFQSCCNGNLCESEYERCCNTTCCNTFTSTCGQGLREGTANAAARRFNPRDFGVFFEACTEIEHLNGFRAFFVFVLPAALLFATLISLALVAVVARRATEHIFELTERALVVVAALVTLLAIPFFFSPLFKWGLVIALLGLAAIVVAVARRLDASLVLLILALAVLLYVVNPFANNNYIGATSATKSQLAIENNRFSESLFEAAKNLWTRATPGRVAGAGTLEHALECTSFYDYFKHDMNLRDTSRWSNDRVHTFGYCSREWITALMVLAAILTFLLVLLFLLALFSFLKKLGYKPVEPIQLEIETEEQFIPSMPVMSQAQPLVSQVQPLLASANPVF